MTTVVLTWIASDGTETALIPSNGYTVLQDPAGVYAPPVVSTIDSFAQFDGASLVSTRRPARSIVIPLQLTHPSRVLTRFAELAAAVRSPGSLRWDDGTNVRTLKRVVYEGGLADAGDPTQGELVVPLAMTALDPWWYGEATSQTLPVSAPTAFNAAVAFNGAIPFNGGASVSVVNPGVEAYPLITVTGPADEVTVGCAGLAWQTTIALSATDVLLVDSRPGTRGPRLNGAPVDWSLLTEASRLWPLPAGTASVVVGTVGSTGATSLAMQWEPRYATP
jgi:hypothetical protein